MVGEDGNGGRPRFSYSSMFIVYRCRERALLNVDVKGFNSNKLVCNLEGFVYLKVDKNHCLPIYISFGCHVTINGTK